MGPPVFSARSGEEPNMSRTCKITGKRPNVANHVSHAHNKTKRRQLPNIQDKRLWVDELGRFVTVRLSARALRTVSKKGLMPYLRERKLTLKDVSR